MMSGEYSSGTIRSTLATVPDRQQLLTAKAVVLGAIALAVGEAVASVTFFAGRTVLTDAVRAPALTDPGVPRAVVLSGVYLSLVGLIGIGIGALTRHTASAISALVASRSRPRPRAVIGRTSSTRRTP